MAQKVRVELVDDLDGGAADETVVFSLDGKAYEIDLNAENADTLRDVLRPYVTAARRTGKTTRGARSAETSDERQAIRKWAKENGMEVGKRGRIGHEVRAAYAKAQA